MSPLARIELETGFKSFEGSLQNQLVFYGISANWAKFQTMDKGVINTGSLVVLLDTKETYAYYAPTDTWYKQ